MRPLVALLLAACGSTPQNIADDGIPDAGPGMPTAVLSTAPDLVGYPTRLDGSGSVDSLGSALTYSWHFAQVPAGSKNSDGELAAVSTPSFSPDRGGAYTVALTVTNAGGASATVQAVFNVPTVPLFYRAGQFGAMSENVEVGVVRSDGTGAHSIACAVTMSFDGGPPIGADYQFPTLYGMRVWDPPGGGVSKLVWEEARGGSQYRLFVSDENGDCTAHPPVELDDGTASSHLWPRFSPNGMRVAYVDGSRPDGVITVGIDGTNRHVVRTIAGRDPGTPPVWIDDATIAWVEDQNASGSSHLVLLKAADATGAGDSAATTLLDCNPADATTLRVINQFEFSGTSVIAAGGTQSRLEVNHPVEVDLYRLTTCSTTGATLLASEPPGGDSWDFALSPDGKTIVLSSSHGQVLGDAGTPPHDLFTVAADGSVPLTRFAGSSATLDDIGPRWVAGGRQLAWTQLGASSGLAIANPNGQSVRAVYSQTGVVVSGPTNRGADCAIGGAGVAPLTLLTFALVALLRRRRR